MRRLDLYIFRQCLTPLVFAIIVITMIVWMTQSLQRIDILVDHGSGLPLFAWLSILIIPSLLSVIIPIAIFGSAIYALQRMHADSEVAVMFAAGVSRWRIAIPFLIIGVIGALITLWVNLDLMPRSYRILKENIAEIRADFATSVLRSGEFTTVVDGLTIYVEEARPGNQFIGLLVNDFRKADKTETYMAQGGVFRETANGPILFLKNGNIQRSNNESAKVEFINFQETAVNIDSFTNNRASLQLELTERFLSELFNPDMTNQWDRDNAGKLISEGHNRLASPLYAFAYVLLAIYSLIGGAYSRQGYGMRVVIACAIAGALRIAGFIIQGISAQTAMYWLIYLIPIGAIFVFAILISDFYQFRSVNGSQKTETN